MKKGTQVVFIPMGLAADHPDVCRGFVVSEVPMGPTVFCRFWLPGAEGSKTFGPIAADARRLTVEETCPQALVDALLETALEWTVRATSASALAAPAPPVV